MEFGLFQNGFRPTTSAAQTYDEDLAEIVLADQLGFRDVWISEHHGEPVYINKVDTLPIPELLMCRAASVTKNIRMGPAVKLLHLAHPLDIALQAAITDHMLHGHTHQPARHDLGEGHARWVLSDGDMHATPPRAEVMRLQGSDAEPCRLSLTEATSAH